MKIIITESQYNKLTEDNLRKLCYTVWNKQKKMGEQPHLDDIIYDITDIRKNMTHDYVHKCSKIYDNVINKLNMKYEEDTTVYKT